MFNRQDAFDIAVKGIIAQGGPSTSEADITACAYRGKNGRKCAVGFLISDADYGSDLEGLTIKGGAIYRLAKRLEWDIPFLEALQQAHDRASTKLDDATGRYIPTDGEEFLRDFRRRARKVAIRFGVDPAVLDAPPVVEPA